MPEIIPMEGDLLPKTPEEMFLILKASIDRIYYRLDRIEAKVFGDVRPPATPSQWREVAPHLKHAELQDKWRGAPTSGMIWRYKQMFQKEPVGLSFREVWVAINPDKQRQVK